MGPSQLNTVLSMWFKPAPHVWLPHTHIYSVHIGIPHLIYISSKGFITFFIHTHTDGCVRTLAYIHYFFPTIDCSRGGAPVWPWRQCNTKATLAAPKDSKLPRTGAAPMKQIRLISCGLIGHVSDIKLIRTDTTLDLSQKAEKGMISSLFLLPYL